MELRASRLDEEASPPVRRPQGPQPYDRLPRLETRAEPSVGGSKRQAAFVLAVPWRVAVKAAPEGIALAIEVAPGSRASRFPAGFNAWRARLEAKVRAPPEAGKANAELVALVADALDVPAARVAVISGQASRRKTVSVTGLDVDTAVDRLAARMA